MKKFQILEHSGDLKIKVWGQDSAELFKNAAVGMFSAAIGCELKTKNAKLKRNLEIEGQNPEELLINFLNELIFLSDTFKEIYLEFDFHEFSENKILGLASGASLPPKGFQIQIKAATHHGLKIKKSPKVFTTEILFDI